MRVNHGAIVAAAAACLCATVIAVAGPSKPRKPIDWVQINPKFKDATFVKDPEACRSCHEDVMKPYAGTVHAHAFGVKPPPETGDCESCHGPRSEHVKNPTGELRIDEGSKAQSQICLQSHEGGSRIEWKAGTHHSNDVSCSSCHTVMVAKSPKALLSKATTNETCFTCHGEVRAETNKMSHHPIREGRMDCASCHNAHGATPDLLVKPTLNETCFTCHTEKRSPVLWEHAPVRESCANCHAPHGSTQRFLLTHKDPFLCLSCHSYGGHINLPRYNRVSNPYGNGCVNCHVTVHGSNHPSGAKFTR